MSCFLVACDGSEPSERALALAARHASALAARIVLLHVVGPGSLPESSRALARVEHLIGDHGGGGLPGIARLPSWVAEFREPSRAVGEQHEAAAAFGRQVLQRAQNLAEHHGLGGAVATEMRDGDAAEQILACAGDHEVDLVALGSRGLGALESVLLGSVSTRVLHAGHRPCLIVP